MTTKPLAELVREAHEAVVTALELILIEHLDREQAQMEAHAAIDALAARAEAADKTAWRASQALAVCTILANGDEPDQESGTEAEAAVRRLKSRAEAESKRADENAGDATVLRAFCKEFGMTPSMMASAREIAEKRAEEAETALLDRVDKIADREDRIAELEREVERYQRTFRHVHAAGQPPNNIDRCETCGLDLRDEIHERYKERAALREED